MRDALADSGRGAACCAEDLDETVEPPAVVRRRSWLAAVSRRGSGLVLVVVDVEVDLLGLKPLCRDADTIILVGPGAVGVADLLESVEEAEVSGLRARAEGCVVVEAE